MARLGGQSGENVWHIAAQAARRRQRERQGADGCRCLLPSFLPAALQVYAAKGKQRMRTGGNTRMMQQMQMQQVSHVPGGSAERGQCGCRVLCRMRVLLVYHAA